MQQLPRPSYAHTHLHLQTQQQQKLLNLFAWSPISNKLIFQLTHNFADRDLKLIIHDMFFLLCLKHDLQSKENHLPNKSFLISPEFWNSDYPKHFISMWRVCMGIDAVQFSFKWCWVPLTRGGVEFLPSQALARDMKTMCLNLPCAAPPEVGRSIEKT